MSTEGLKRGVRIFKVPFQRRAIMDSELDVQNIQGTKGAEQKERERV